MLKGQFFGKIGTKLVNFGTKIPHFLGKLQKFSPLRAKNFEKLHCKGMIFHRNSLHFKGPILEVKFWAERMVVLRSSAPPGTVSWLVFTSNDAFVDARPGGALDLRTTIRSAQNLPFKIGPLQCSEFS